MDNTKRFSDRVEDYIKYRPGYPDEIIQILEQNVLLENTKVIADIGSGTGLSALPFLKKQYKVLGVEPNKEMREAAAQLLSDYPNFISVNGTAESTNLESDSIDLVFCGQAFHWFDKLKCKSEFDRILKDTGNIVLVWNSRSTKSDFQKAYESALYDYVDEYKFVNHRNIDEAEIASFFLSKSMHKLTLENKQLFDLQGLKGRLKSSSYCPKGGQIHDRLMAAMEHIFEKYETNGVVEFLYDTQIYWC